MAHLTSLNQLMRLPTATGLVLRLRLSAVVLASLVFIDTATAQQIQFGFAAPPKTELTVPQVDLVSGAVAARLKQAEVLASEKSWDEAIDIYRELATDGSDRVVALDESRYVTLQTYCHLQLARLPAEGLAVYRRRVDPLAERWFREGLAARDEPLLRRIVEELFCSSWGDDALLALGELALERADYAAARRCWEQISPLLRDPTGLPLWIALRDIDVGAHWPDIERRWLDRPTQPGWLAYPDTQLELADVRARLVLTSIRAGQLDRAALELEAFRRFHPTAIGRLGGQDGRYVEALERLLIAARDWPTGPRDTNWPTFAGSPSRSRTVPEVGDINGLVWDEPIKLTVPNVARLNSQLIAGGPFGGGLIEQIDESPAVVRESQRPLSCFPIVVNGLVVFADAAAIHAVKLASGKPAITPDGVLKRNEPLDKTNPAVGLGGLIAHGVPRYTLTAADGIVYTRIGRLTTTQLESRRGSSSDRLIGIDLSRDGLLAFSAQVDDASWSFDGVPVVDDHRLYIALRHSDVAPRAFVACYDTATGAELWRTSIGAADTPAAGRGDEITHNLLTLIGDRIYFNTNLGLVAALDAQDGKVCWLHRYDRLSGESFVPDATHPLCFDRDPSPCLYHDGLLVVAPADSPTVFALDADTGQLVWQTDALRDTLHLLAVVGQNLIVSGNRLWAVDVRSGNVGFVWPESDHAGIRGMGRGLVAGDEIFWPTRNDIYVVHAATGAQTRPPINLSPVSDCGANLAAGHGRLVVAGHSKLMAFGLTSVPQRNESETSETARRTGRLSGQLNQDR